MEKVKIVRAGATSFSFGGVEYQPNKAGVFEVPEEAAAVAIAEFGFTLAKPEKAREKSE